MKKEAIQSRNRKLSAKARKKHSSFTSAVDMLKPLEKMYGSYGMAAMSGMSSYYMPNSAASMSAAAGMHTAAGAGAAAAATSASQFGSAAAAGMHMTAALGGFGAAAGCPPSFGGMVSKTFFKTFFFQSATDWISLKAHDRGENFFLLHANF